MSHEHKFAPDIHLGKRCGNFLVVLPEIGNEPWSVARSRASPVFTQVKRVKVRPRTMPLLGKLALKKNSQTTRECKEHWLPLRLV